MATSPALLLDYGLPPWEELVGHASCKYASPRVAKSVSHPWVWALVEAMRATMPPASPVLVDVRWWDRLEVGDSPGLPHWHYDCHNAEDDPRSADEEHRLYFAGAGSRTMFEGGFQPPEGWVTRYDHRHRHRVMPATVPGPRLLVRVSRTTIRPANQVRPPPLFRACGQVQVGAPPA